MTWTSASLKIVIVCIVNATVRLTIVIAVSVFPPSRGMLNRNIYKPEVLYSIEDLVIEAVKMKFLREKGQGSLEYLMILAAVLAIAVVVVVIASSFLYKQRVIAEISNQKALCATKGIDLPNYKDAFYTDATDAATKLRVVYQGTVVGEPTGTQCDDAQPADPSWVEASCEIGDPTMKPMLTVAANSSHCWIYQS